MNSKKILSINLVKLMEKYGVDRIKLSTDLDIKYTTLTGWIKCQNYPRVNNINKLANYFHGNWADLVDPKASRLPKDAIIDDGNYRKSPVIDQIACGNLIDAIKTTGTYKLTNTDNLPSGVNYWLKCKGDSYYY